MHLVAINQFYAPHSSATAQLLTELAEGLVSRGHRVTVVAARAQDDMAPGTRSLLPTTEQRNGVQVARIPSTSFGKRSLLHRASDYASFYGGAAATLAGLSRKNPPVDVYLALSTPPLIALAPQLAAIWRQTPVVSLVQDLYPDVAVALGAVKRDSLTERLWARMTRLSLGRSDHVVVLSDAMAKKVAAYGVGPDRISVIPNWALAELEGAPSPTLGGRGGRGRLEYGLGDRFVVMYSGNLGAGHSFETLLDAARQLRDRRDIVFAIVGDGMRRSEVERFVATHGLDNVRLFPLAPRDQLSESLAAADLHVITMRDGLEGLIVPSKLYGILAVARPALFIGPNGDGIARTLTQSRCGLSFENGDVSGVISAITELADQRETCRNMGERGRHLVDTDLSRVRAIDHYERLLVRLSRMGAPQREAIAGTRAEASA